jgi:hypothetical protein
MDQGDLAPIVLFRDARGGKDGKLFLADGHHRHHVYRNMLKPKRQEIPAIVIDSDDPAREALEFATMCNREMCLGRSQEDIAKAIEMLLADKLWWAKSDAWIADHVGCIRDKVVRIRARMCLETGKTEPKTVLRRDGKERPYRQSRSDGANRRITKGKDGRFRGYFKKKQISATNPDDVRAKLVEIDESDAVRRSLGCNAINKFLADRGFLSPFGQGITNNFRGIRAYWIPGIVCQACDFSTIDSVPLIAGQLVGARQYKEPTARMVVLCYVEDGPPEVIDLYRQAGFEFMTPDELAESLKGGE